MTVTGEAVSASTRLMFEPVTSIFSTFCGAGVCATAEAAAIRLGMTTARCVVFTLRVLLKFGGGRGEVQSLVTKVLSDGNVSQVNQRNVYVAFR